jgi:type IV secretion system protein VirB1
MELVALSALALLANAAPPAVARVPSLPAAELIGLLKRCAPTVAPETMAAVIRVESAGHPFAIGVVGGKLERQPHSLDEAVATAEALERAGRNFSVGLVQVNRFNLARFGLTYRTAFEPCANLRAGSKLLEECYLRAVAARHPDPLAAAVSCYYSGTFSRGFQQEPDGQASYVGLVLRRPDGLLTPGKDAPAEKPPRRVTVADKAASQEPQATLPEAAASPAAPTSSTAANSPVVF